MESIEVWMWIIAGMIMAGLVFMGGFSLLSKYIYNTEKETTNNNFEALYSSINSVCFGGTYTREFKSYTFPFTVKKIYVEDSAGIEMFGKNLCFEYREESPICMTVKNCNVDMNSVYLEQKSGLFYHVQRSLGKKGAAKIHFNITKTKLGLVNVPWARELTE